MTTVPAASTLTDLVRFLLARIEEDTQEVARLRRRQSRSATPVDDLTGLRSLDRLRADCDARRQLIGHAQQLLVLRDLPLERSVRDTAAQMLRALAVPYRDHYAYREEWLRDH